MPVQDELKMNHNGFKNIPEIFEGLQNIRVEGCVKDAIPSSRLIVGVDKYSPSRNERMVNASLALYVIYVCGYSRSSHEKNR